MITTSDGNKVKFYCKECGNEVVTPTIYMSLSTPLYYVRCYECKNCTPMFRYQLDALKYYKKEWGLTREFVS